MGIRLSPMAQRRLHNFKSNRRGYISLWIFLILFILSGAPSLEGKIIGILLLLAGTFTWSLGQVLVKEVSENLNGIALTAWIGILAGPQLIIGSQIIEGNVYNNLITAEYMDWLIILYLGILMNCL